MPIPRMAKVRKILSKILQSSLRQTHSYGSEFATPMPSFDEFLKKNTQENYLKLAHLVSQKSKINLESHKDKPIFCLSL